MINFYRQNQPNFLKGVRRKGGRDLEFARCQVLEHWKPTYATHVYCTFFLSLKSSLKGCKQIALLLPAYILGMIQHLVLEINIFLSIWFMNFLFTLLIFERVSFNQIGF